LIVGIVGAITFAALAVPGSQLLARPGPRPSTVLPPVGHVFVINLENKGYDTTFSASSPAQHLTSTLRAQGMLMTQYYGTAHNSLPNYLAQISGQAPNPQTQGS
jgi:hypothetical protein